MPSPVGSTPDNRSTTSKAPPGNGFASQPIQPNAPGQKPLVTAVKTLIPRDPLEPTIKAPHVLLLDTQQSKTAQTSTEPTYANTELKPQDHPLAPPNMAAVPGPSTRHNPSSQPHPRRTQSWRSSLMESKTCTLLTSPVHLCLCRARLVHFTHGFSCVPAAHLASYQARQTLKRAPRMTLHPLFGAYAPRAANRNPPRCTGPELEVFKGEWNHQFGVYRMMRTHCLHRGEGWAGYRPLTNVMWLHYLVGKLLEAKGLPNVSDRRSGFRQVGDDPELDAFMDLQRIQQGLGLAVHKVGN